MSLFSCEKSEKLETQVDPIKKEVNDNLSKKLKGGLFAAGNLHRPIQIRPRDNQPCACEYCFGICGEKWELQVEWSNYVPPIGLPVAGDPIRIGLEELDHSKIKLYIFEDIDWMESTIIVDNDIDFEVQDYGVIKLLAGEYDFTEQTGVFRVENLEIPYYGYFIGDIAY